MYEIYVRAASPVSLSSLSQAGTTFVIDGVTLIDGELVLLPLQSGVYPNGIYSYTQSSNSISIKPPYNSADGVGGQTVIVLAGKMLSRTQWNVQADVTGSTTYSTRVAQLPGYVVDNVPPGIVYDLNAGIDNAVAIQTAINHCLQLDEGLANINSYWQTSDLNSSGTVVVPSTIGVLYRQTAGGATTFQLPTSLAHPGSLYFMLCADGSLAFTGAGASISILFYNNVNGAYGSQPLTMRFAAAKAYWNGTSWQVTDASVTAGGTIYLPGGQILFNLNGIKLHPAVSLKGENEGTTYLHAVSGFTGAPDASATGQDAALLYVCARAPYVGASGGVMFNPRIENVNFLMDGNTPHIDGIFFEKGGLDPFYPFNNLPQAYKGSSAAIYTSTVKGFGGWGVYVTPDRQRFYCESLRCFGNGVPHNTGAGGGILVAGNDATIGPNSGFGSNNGTSVTVSDCSAAIMTGVNVWESMYRDEAGLACRIINMNGMVITGCKFNDTVSIEVGSSNNNLETPIVLSACEFNPNTDVFDQTLGTPIWNGTTSSVPYDAFIRVADMQNVNISGCSFDANTSTFAGSGWHCYAYIVTAVQELNQPAQVVFTGSVQSGQGALVGTNPVPIGNYRTTPVYAGIPGTNGGCITYSVRDLTGGASISGSLGYLKTGVVVPTPDMRGVDFSSIDGYRGYAAVDNGPLLQLSNPELLEGKSILHYVWNTGTAATVRVPSTVRYLILNTTGSAPSVNLTLDLMLDSAGNPDAPANNAILTICALTNSVITSPHLKFHYQGGTSFPTGSDLSFPGGLSPGDQLQFLIGPGGNNVGPVNLIGKY